MTRPARIMNGPVTCLCVQQDVLPPCVHPAAAGDAHKCRIASCHAFLVQADTLGVPMVDEDRSHFLALVNAKVGVSWDGRRIVAPPGVVDEHGMCDLEPYMPANFKKPKQQSSVAEKKQE